jgi:ankyrin repeat protein
MATTRTQDLSDQLMTACADGRLTDVEASLQKLKESHPREDPDIQSMMMAASLHDRSNVVKFCLDAGATITEPVVKEVIRGHSFTTYKLLVSSGLDINHGVPWYGDVLIVAVQSNNLPWATFCLENGADPNMHLVDDSKSALAAAAETSSQEMLALLLKHHALLENSGALVVAAEAGRFDNVKYLLDQGADIDEVGLECPDSQEMEDMGSALHKATTGGHVEVVKLLLDRGAEMNLRDAQNRTPLGRAKEKGDENMIKLLRARGTLE